MRIFFLLFFLPVLLVACKKDKDKLPGNLRVRSILNGTSSEQIFTYDEQKRLIRLDRNALYSIRLTYSPAGVLIQGYDGANDPVPDNRSIFTIVGGKIVGGNQYRSNNEIDKYSFEYDAQQRLNTVIIRRTYNDIEESTNRYWISYDAQNNVAAISVRKEFQGQNDDSLYIARTYYNDKPYLLWKDIGFDYYGSAAIAQLSFFGDGLSLPLLLARDYHPSEHALKSLTQQNFSWNALTKKWIAGQSSTKTYDEGMYKYDQRGRFIGHDGDLIEWE